MASLGESDDEDDSVEEDILIMDDKQENNILRVHKNWFKHGNNIKAIAFGSKFFYLCGTDDRLSKYGMMKSNLLASRKMNVVCRQMEVDLNSKLWVSGFSQQNELSLYKFGTNLGLILEIKMGTFSQGKD